MPIFTPEIVRNQRSFRVAAALLVLTGLGMAPTHAQGVTVDMHWVGLFGAFSPHPVENDPLPDITLFPMGELPRPLTRTNRVPAKIGTRFGLLFTLRGAKTEGFVQVSQIVHYPPPGIWSVLVSPQCSYTKIE
jgi:hypothetical protein